MVPVIDNWHSEAIAVGGSCDKTNSKLYSGSRRMSFNVRSWDLVFHHATSEATEIVHHNPWMFQWKLPSEDERFARVCENGNKCGVETHKYTSSIPQSFTPAQPFRAQLFFSQLVARKILTISRIMVFLSSTTCLSTEKTLLLHESCPETKEIRIDWKLQLQIDATVRII